MHTHFSWFFFNFPFIRKQKTENSTKRKRLIKLYIWFIHCCCYYFVLFITSSCFKWKEIGNERLQPASDIERKTERTNKEVSNEWKVFHLNFSLKIFSFFYEINLNLFFPSFLPFFVAFFLILLLLVRCCCYCCYCFLCLVLLLLLLSILFN